MDKNLEQMMSPEELSPVTEVLRGIRLSGSFYCESNLLAPWGFENPDLGVALFHFAVQGGYWLGMEGKEPLFLREGDMMLIPKGKAHSLCDTPDGKTVPTMEIHRTMFGENASRMTLGGDGERSFLICGGVTFEPLWHPLIEVLPDVIVVSREKGMSRPWLKPLFGLLKNEAGAGRPGGEAIVTRLCDVLVLEAIRDWMETASDTPVGWLTALRDNQIGKAIAAIHSEPNHPWTVALLAAKASMSRSVFTERFAGLCGIPPLQYVMRWRMNLAGDWLQQTRLTTGEVADRLGYSSDATFSRAFKRYWGIAPGRFRRQPASGRQMISGELSAHT